MKETLHENETLDTSQIKRYSTLINGHSEEGDPIEKMPLMVESNPKPETKLLQNMSSGLGTTNDSSKGTLSTSIHKNILTLFLPEEPESVELKNFNLGTSADTEHDEESALCPEGKTNKKCEKKDSEDDENRPWHALVSYVDELTLGGRRNSKGQYVDGMGSFPGFGRPKKSRTPPECFPQHCYER